MPLRNAKFVILGAAFFLPCLRVSLCQSMPPSSLVPEPYRHKFVQFVDKRSFTEKALNAVGFSNQEVGRSFALLAGVSKYPNMPEVDRTLPAAAADVDELADYLQREEFFDEIVILKDGDVTEDNLRYFLENYFTDRLRKFPKSRFLFAYSGHGMSEGAKNYPTGFLLTSAARSLDDKLNSINMTVLRVYLDEVVEAGYQTLALINACYSGAFVSRRPFGSSSGDVPPGGVYFPRYAGAHAITAGGSGQLTWHDPRLGRGSVFFEKLLAGLEGRADTLPIYPDGHRGDGIITIGELSAYLQNEVSLATNQQQTPIPADLEINGSQGGFFFLNRERMIAQGLVPDWNPKANTAFGVNVEEKLISGKANYKAGKYAEALPLLRDAAESGSSEAAVLIGLMHRYGFGGLPKDDAQAVTWYRKAADAGNANGMANLGYMYETGRGGLPKDDSQALNLYRTAADAGDAVGMDNLGSMYADGRGGLPKDDAQAVSWYRKAADAGEARGMANLGVMYAGGRGGLPKDEVQAVSWYRKSADAGGEDGMANLGYMYENGLGGLPKDEAQAVSWYRKGADAGSSYAADALKRLNK